MQTTTDHVEVADIGERLRFSFDDLLRYHGPSSPGGVAHAFQVLRRALPALEPDELIDRRAIEITTAFGGPGARDAFELVTRAVTEGRYTVDPALERPERGATLERYVFTLGYRDRTVTLAIRDGFVTDEFITLVRTDNRSTKQNEHLAVLKQQMTDRLLAKPAIDVYDIVSM